MPFRFVALICFLSTAHVAFAQLQSPTTSHENGSDPDVVIRAQNTEAAPLEPSSRQPATQRSATSGAIRVGAIYGSQSANSRNSGRNSSVGIEYVFGAEAFSRATTDAGDLLRKSINTAGVTSQQRTQNVNDTRVRGEKVGQVLAAGSYWFPARMDLDTMLSKIDSRLVDNMIVIKGPYSARYGPAFNFIDVQLLQTPRYSEFEAHGSASAMFKANGDQWLGRKDFWGGSSNWGYHFSYGHSTGNDYEDGAGRLLPASYRSRDVFLALGWDPTPESRVEFTYLRLDQTDLEFPGLVFDINVLVTDGFELKYYNDAPSIGDEFFAEGWYNRTKFSGDTFGIGKNRQLPELQTTLFSPDGMSGASITDARASSSGYRTDTTWYTSNTSSITLGTDLTNITQALNDVEIFLPANDNNFPIPRSSMLDLGIYFEAERQFNRLSLVTGGRVDYVAAQADDAVQGVPDPVSDILDADLSQSDVLWSAFMTGEYAINDRLWAIGGMGMAERPPTLTERYAVSTFIGTLQRGLTFVIGDPLLDPERIRQVDLGVEYRGRDAWLRMVAFNAWIEDFIAYDLTTPADPEGGLTTGVSFVNTDLASFNGLDLQSRFRVTKHLDAFASISFVEGRDHSRDEPADGEPGPRSGVAGRRKEPLPGIPPLQSILGVKVHDGTSNPRYWTELQARIVNNQDRVADSLEESPTPGFTIWNVRSYYRLTPSFLLVSGVENFTDKFYFEHLDYRAGLGVTRPGISPYFGAEVTY